MMPNKLTKTEDALIDAALSAADLYNPGRDPNSDYSYEEAKRIKMRWTVEAILDFKTRKNPDLDWRTIDAITADRKAKEEWR